MHRRRRGQETSLRSGFDPTSRGNRCCRAPSGSTAPGYLGWRGPHVAVLPTGDPGVGLRGAASAAPCGLAPGTSRDTPGGRWQLRASRAALGDLSWGHWGHLGSRRAAVWCPQPCPVWQERRSWWALGRETCHPRTAAVPLSLGLFEFLAGSPRGCRRATAVTGGPGGRGGRRRAVTAAITSPWLP